MLRSLALGAALGLTLALPLSVQAETFRCRAGDVPCLINAINAANANGEANTIRLAAGTYTLTAPDNFSVGPNGLPVITSPLTITGRGAERTSIERDASAPGFRILRVAVGGTLTLQRLTLRGGTAAGGGGILNEGTLTLVRTTVTNNNVGFFDGGGIATSGTLTLVRSAVTSNRAGFGAGIATSGGTVTITHSTIAANVTFSLPGGGLFIEGGTVTITATTITHNIADTGGGIVNGFDEIDIPGGTMIITESAITNNAGFLGGGGGIRNSGTMEITNTTIAANIAAPGTPLSPFSGDGILNSGGTLLLLNSTVADNSSLVLGNGILNESGTVLLQNTLLARNIAGTGMGRDCSGPIISLGTNLIGDPTGCTIPLQPSDLTGDAGLGPFTDNGRPGNGHFPLLPTSQALDAGNDALCPRTDQLGRRRLGPCDIGAIEFRERDDRQHDEEDDEHDEEEDEHDEEDVG